MQHDSNQPVTNKSQAILKTAIVKKPWELNNDDIETCEKIGNVSNLILHGESHYIILLVRKTCAFDPSEASKMGNL